MAWPPWSRSDASDFIGYDRNDRLLEEIGVDRPLRKIEQDACGVPVKVIDAEGQADALTLRMERDALGRLRVKHAPGRSTLYRYEHDVKRF